jgi:hypothetical protein
MRVHAIGGRQIGLDRFGLFSDAQEQLFFTDHFHLRLMRRTLAMKALAWHGKGDTRCDSVPDLKIENGRDAAASGAF